MAGNGKNVIFSASAANVCPDVREKKIKAAQVIKPGHIMAVDSDEFINHASEGNGGAIYVANLSSYGQGDVDDTLTAGDTVMGFVPAPGEVFNVMVAAGENITATDTGLSSNGDGTLKIATVTGATPDVVLFHSEEVINTGASNTLVRCKVANYGTLATA